MRAWIGKTIVLISLIHMSVGVYILWPTLRVLWAEGLINTVSGEVAREFAFWFLAFGLLGLIFGLFLDWCERQKIVLPAFLGWSLLALTVAMVTIMPVSGGYLMFVPAVGILWRSRVMHGRAA